MGAANTNLLKIFAAILTLYLGALIVWPCGDLACEQQLQQTEQHDHDHGEDTEDLCSPFCHCQCCHVNVVLSQPFFSFENADPYTVYSSLYSDLVPDSPFISMFRPPKV